MHEIIVVYLLWYDCYKHLNESYIISVLSLYPCSFESSPSEELESATLNKR